jgi:hypothetical protein
MTETKSDADVFYDKTAEPMKYFAGAHNELKTAALDNLATPADAQKTADDWVGVFARHDLVDASHVAQAVAEVARRPPTAEKAAQWRTDAAEALKSEYGERAGDVLADVRKLVKSDPQLSRYLEKSGAGNHPAVVRAMAATAVAARKAGKLK